jgi:dTMP kinase
LSLFITFEGGEGCGKSLQSAALYRRLQRNSVPSVLIREPGGTPLGEKVRDILKHSCEIEVSPLTELMLFNASRSQLVSEVIKPSLNEGKVVVCDRFTDSTLAYQSGGRGLDIKMVRQVNSFAAQGIIPDLVILLDVPPEIGIRRKGLIKNDRFDRETLEFHNRVRDTFIKLAKEDVNRWAVIDATLSIEAIGDIIWGKVSDSIER